MTRRFNIDRHPSSYSNFDNPEEEERAKKITDRAYEAISAECEHEDYLITSIVMGLISKHTNTMVSNEILEFKKDNNYKPQGNMDTHLNSIAQGLQEIAQLIFRERINYNKVLMKIRRAQEDLT